MPLIITFCTFQRQFMEVLIVTLYSVLRISYIHLTKMPKHQFYKLNKFRFIKDFAFKFCILLFIGRDSTIGGCFCGFVEGSTRRLIFIVVFGEAPDRTCDPWFTMRVN